MKARSCTVLAPASWYGAVAIPTAVMRGACASVQPARSAMSASACASFTASPPCCISAPSGSASNPPASASAATPPASAVATCSAAAGRNAPPASQPYTRRCRAARPPARAPDRRGWRPSRRRARAAPRRPGHRHRDRAGSPHPAATPPRWRRRRGRRESAHSPGAGSGWSGRCWISHPCNVLPSGDAARANGAKPGRPAGSVPVGKLCSV